MARHVKNDKPVLTPELNAVEPVVLPVAEVTVEVAPPPVDAKDKDDSDYDDLDMYCVKPGSSINGLTRIYGPGEPLRPEYFRDGEAKIKYLIGLGLLEKCKDK